MVTWSVGEVGTEPRFPESWAWVPCAVRKGFLLCCVEQSEASWSNQSEHQEIEFYAGYWWLTLVPMWYSKTKENQSWGILPGDQRRVTSPQR
jgi:hypothetical protein